MKITRTCQVQSLIFIILTFFPCIKITAQGKIISLNSSNSTLVWKIKPQADIQKDSVKIYEPGYNTSSWINATVPGTVFSSYVDAGLEKDPNYADNIYNVDKSKYDRNYWYRTEFQVPEDFFTGKLWLNFNGVNRDADIFLNGKYLGAIRGFMQRGRYDITNITKKDAPNCLAVLVYLPQNPVSNGASPTYGSSAGWDWMPYVPGLNMGIQDEVFLSNSGQVSITDPWIRVDLPDSSSANIVIKAELKNNSSKAQAGILTGTINPGNFNFSLNVTIPANETKTVSIDNNGFPELSIRNPLLWWPNGYGPQNLYSCSLKFTIDKEVSDLKDISFGIKKYSYDTTGGVLKIMINGVRIFAKGGNWGMPEYMLRCRDKDYDTKVRLHKDMNFNIIRNWMGSTTDEAFYNACDKYGIMVWDDFWLNSSGGLPRDINVFNANSIEKIKRLRNHPSIALWCGDNEGEPLPPLNDWLKANISTFDDRHYHPNSHSWNLSGSGPWTNLEPADYFMKAAPGNWGGNSGWGLRSEIGTAVFVSFDSFKKFIPEDKWWPRNEMWDKHFFGPSAIYAGPDTYEACIKNRYGAPSGIEEYCRKAQLLNIETNKAMFEGWLDNLWNDASGIIIWMSQSAFPSMVWQTYDYYYDNNGAYWGAKKACEPLHIQWNPAQNSVKVINTTLQDLKDLTAEAEIYNMDGNEVSDLRKSTKINVKKNSLQNCFFISAPASDLAYKKNTFASSYHVDGRQSWALTDGDNKTRWESDFGDQQWAYVDLGEVKNINHVRLSWENAHAKTYKIQISEDARFWKDVYYTSDCNGGVEDVTFKSVDARYVRMYCIEKATSYGISLWSFEVYGEVKQELSDVHFIKLSLKDSKGNLLSDNLYWRGMRYLDYKSINNLPGVDLKVTQKVTKKDGKCIISAQITNPLSSQAIALAVHLQVEKAKSGDRVLPVIMNDNYFSLVKGETKQIHIEFDESLLNGEEPTLHAEPFNSGKIKL